jgi:undecaprenyl-diphosphatase
MTWITALIFGLVEGITEFLPISSTAHLIITAHLFQIPQTEFIKTFEIVIQLGAILAIVWLYKDRLLTNSKTWLKIISAFIPTAIVGFLLYEFIKTTLLESNFVISAALIIGGIVLIFFDNSQDEESSSQTEIENLSYKQSVLIGLAQSMAIIPGVSRAAATIVSGRLLGLSRLASIEFSFLLAVPTIAAASGYDLLKSGTDFSSSEFILLVIGFISSFIFAFITIKWLIKYIASHNFKGFGYYRILVGFLFLIIFAL